MKTKPTSKVKATKPTKTPKVSEGAKATKNLKVLKVLKVLKTPHKYTAHTRESIRRAIQETRKRFNPTIQQTISISPAHLDTLERMIFEPLQAAATAEVTSKATLRPATKALESLNTMNAEERQRFILECSIKTYAGAELQRSALKIMAQGKGKRAPF